MSQKVPAGTWGGAWSSATRLGRVARAFALSAATLHEWQHWGPWRGCRPTTPTIYRMCSLSDAARVRAHSHHQLVRSFRIPPSLRTMVPFTNAWCSFNSALTL